MTRTEWTIDKATGLPTLPPKYRWRVTDFDANGLWGTKIQYLLFGLIPFTVAASWSGSTPSTDAVQDHAEIAYQRWAHNRRLWEGNPYRGNYPPKRLGDS